MIKRRGLLFVVSAPSGAGKTTLCNMLKNKYDNLSYSVSFTTREPRTGELDKVHYNFIAEEKFQHMIDNNEFLEYAIVHANHYGTSKAVVLDALDRGKDILLDIDTQGAMQLKEKMPDAVFVFIAPPSIDELRKRIASRKDNTKEVDLRISNARKEVQDIYKYDYVIVNDDLSKAIELLSSIYLAATCSTKINQITIV